MPIHVERDGDVATLRLAHPRGNAIGADFVRDLGRVLDGLEGARTPGLLLASSGSAFCVGLDLIAA